MMCKRKNLNLIILICLYLQIDNSMAKDNEFFYIRKLIRNQIFVKNKIQII